MPYWRLVSDARRSPLKAYVQVVGLVALTVLLGLLLRLIVPLESVTVLLLLPVVGAALFWGFEHAMVAAILAIACGIPFYDPVLTFELRYNRDIVDLAVFALVAIIVGHLGESLRQRSFALEKRESELRHLYELSHEIAAAPDAGSILRIVACHLSKALGRPVDLLTREDLAKETTISMFPAEITEAARSMLQAGGRSRAVVTTGTQETWLIACIGPFDEEGVAVAANIGRLEGSQPSTLEEAASILDEGASSLDRLGFARALDERRLRGKMDEVRTALFDSASHELRTPLATIQGAVTALQDVEEVAGQERLASMVQLAAKECERLNRVIQNMLDEGRVRSGHLPVRLEVVEAAEIVRDAIRQAHLRLASHRLEIALPEDGPFVEADPHLVAQALINMLENAAKFSAAGATIKVSLRVEGKRAEIKVRDEGRGLSHEEAGRVFERFYRGATGYESIGSGLGLSVAKAFVEASNGELLVDSPGPGGGASFTLLLTVTHPAQAPDDDE
ncbi:MAG: DUF4118 domain-containing protein [Rhizobiales bacterium]|nr:DUF4118 domain-containing protein [Hyphomicrobiales bacterium]